MKPVRQLQTFALHADRYILVLSTALSDLGFWQSCHNDECSKYLMKNCFNETTFIFSEIRILCGSLQVTSLKQLKCSYWGQCLEAIVGRKVNSQGQTKRMVVCMNMCLYLDVHFSTKRHLIATDFQEPDVARLADMDT